MVVMSGSVLRMCWMAFRKASMLLGLPIRRALLSAVSSRCLTAGSPAMRLMELYEIPGHTCNLASPVASFEQGFDFMAF